MITEKLRVRTMYDTRGICLCTNVRRTSSYNEKFEGRHVIFVHELLYPGTWYRVKNPIKNSIEYE